MTTTPSPTTSPNVSVPSPTEPVDLFSPSTGFTPPHIQNRQGRPNRTMKKKARQIWVDGNRSITKRVKALVAECEPLMAKYNMKANGISSTSRASSSRNSSQPTASTSRSHYKKSIGSLHMHAQTALEALSEITNVSSDKKLRELNKTCERAVESYEKEIVVVSDKIRVEALRLDQEFRTLSQFVEASAEKFERWERNRSDPSNAPATPLSSNDIHVPSTRSEVIEMKEFAPGSNPTRDDENSCDTSIFSTASSEASVLPPPPPASANLNSFAVQASKIDKMIARDGGKTGNWHPDEHAYFLKAWTRCGEDIDSVVDALRTFSSAVLKNRSNDEVLGHAAWYMQYVARTTRKKELSQQWRKKKNEERDRKVKAQLDNQEQIEKKNAPVPPSGEVAESLRKAEADKKEAIRLWKEKKQREKDTKEADKARVVEEQQLQWEKRMQENQFRRAAVNDFKQQKERDKQRAKKIESMMKASTQRRGLTREEIEQKRNMEMQRARQRRRMAEDKERTRMMREAKIRGAAKGISESRYSKARDFDRLTGDTKASGARAYSAEELDDLDELKKRRGAHDRPVHLNTRDLMVGGGAGRRGQASWRSNIN